MLIGVENIGFQNRVEFRSDKILHPADVEILKRKKQLRFARFKVFGLFLEDKTSFSSLLLWWSLGKLQLGCILHQVRANLDTFMSCEMFVKHTLAKGLFFLTKLAQSRKNHQPKNIPKVKPNICRAASSNQFWIFYEYPISSRLKTEAKKTTEFRITFFDLPKRQYFPHHLSFSQAFKQQAEQR